jgi:hypothetical protein
MVVAVRHAKTPADHLSQAGGRPQAENLLAWRFDPASPNEACVAEIAYIPTQESWL